MKKFYYDFGTGIFECFFIGEVVFFRCAIGPNKWKAYKMTTISDFQAKNKNIELYDDLKALTDKKG